MTTFDVSEITSLDEFKEKLGEAGVVFAVDKTNPENRHLLLGRATLAAIAQETIPPQPIEVVGFEMNMAQECSDYEKLVAALLTTRGVCEMEDRVMTPDDLPGGGRA